MERRKIVSRTEKSTYVYRLMNLRFLPPKIVEDILNGKQEVELTVKKLHELARI